MKKRLVVLMLVLFTAQFSFAYDWVAKDNNGLRADMLEFAKQFSNEVKGTKASVVLNKFIKEQEKLAETDNVAWIGATLDVVNRLTKIYSPVVAKNDIHSKIRRMTLQLLDYPLHVDNFGVNNAKPLATEEEIEAYKDFCAKYTLQARQKFLKWLDSPLPEEGKIDIFKIYNMGFVIRTAHHSIAIDIRWEGTEEEAVRIADKVDIFVLSHAHGDHYSEVMLKAIANANKPMVLSEDVAPYYNSDKKVIVKGDILEPMDFGGIKVATLLGYQWPAPCNIFMIEMDNWRFIQNGDNNDIEKELGVQEFPAYDFVITAAWNSVPNILGAAMKAKNPDGRKLYYFPAHENELTHPVDHRESFHETYSRKDRLGNPDFKYPDHVLLNIGEHFVLSK